MNELSLLDTLFGNDGFGIPYRRNSIYAPKVDVVQKKDGYVLSMDLPGKTEKDVDITLKNDVLTIASAEEGAQNANAENNEEETYILRERTVDYTKFSRSFTLPKDIDSDKVSATFKNGILFVEIGRKTDAAEKKIAIQAVS